MPVAFNLGNPPGMQMTDTSIHTAEMPPESTMRQALAERDAHYDGAFVYGVTTTGVYCRPSCRSRQPKPDNVRFFADPAAAESAGLRECKRCRPRDAHDRTASMIQSLAAYIETHAGEPL